MDVPRLGPDVRDEAPTGPDITAYDEEHLVTYLRVLSEEEDGADWADVARSVLHRDPSTDAARAGRCWESHLARAQWMEKSSYRLIHEGASADRR